MVAAAVAVMAVGARRDGDEGRELGREAGLGVGLALPTTRVGDPGRVPGREPWRDVPAAAVAAALAAPPPIAVSRTGEVGLELGRDAALDAGLEFTAEPGRDGVFGRR